MARDFLLLPKVFVDLFLENYLEDGSEIAAPIGEFLVLRQSRLQLGQLQVPTLAERQIGRRSAGDFLDGFFSEVQRIILKES